MRQVDVFPDTLVSTNTQWVMCHDLSHPDFLPLPPELQHVESSPRILHIPVF